MSLLAPKDNTGLTNKRNGLTSYISDCFSLTPTPAGVLYEFATVMKLLDNPPFKAWLYSILT